MEVVEDLPGAENDDAIAETLKFYTRQSLEDLDDEALHSGMYSANRQGPDEQLDMLATVIAEIQGELEWCTKVDLDSEKHPFIDTHEKQEALRLAIGHGGYLDERFLRRHILSIWEGIRGERKKRPKRHGRQKRQKRQKQHGHDIISQKAKLNVSSAEECTANDVIKQHGHDTDSRKVTPLVSLTEGRTANDLLPQTVTFPSIRTLTDDVLNKLADTNFRVRRLKSYTNEITSFGLQALKDKIRQCIRPELQSLEGNVVTRQMLDDILEGQEPLSEWPAIEVIQGHSDTLCYWVASKPGRQLNFVRLWEINADEETCGKSLELLNNLIEMIFCLAFQSLPLPTLKRFLGSQVTGLRGLNVVSPLLQNLPLGPAERGKYRSWLQHSPSLESQEFAQIRGDQLQKELASSFQPSSSRPTYQDIERAFRDAIALDFSCAFAGHKEASETQQLTNGLSLETIRDKVTFHLQEQEIEETLWAHPFGSFAARIGFVLDFDIFFLQQDKESTLPSHFPLALGSIGFNEENCLVWPFNFQVPFTPRKFKMAGYDDTLLREVNRQIIDVSNLQVILLCGANAERMTVLPSFSKIELNVRDISCDAFLETDKSRVSRVYLKPSAPLSALYSSNWRSATVMSFAIKVAACLTKTPGISPFYFRSQSVISEVVLARVHEERDGHEMTEDMISENIWSWLHMKGFNRSDLALLKRIGGSISRGILLAVVTAPQRPAKFRPENLRRAVPRVDQPVSNHKFTREQLGNMRKLHEQRQQLIWSTDPIVGSLPREDDDDVLEDEISEDQQDIYLNALAFESSLDPVTNRPNAERLAGSLEIDSPTISLRAPATMPFKLAGKTTSEPTKRTKQLAPLDRKGKDEYCCWCNMPTRTETSRPCWSDIFQKSLCQRCSSHLRRDNFLQICRAQILYLDIPCGFCGSLVGPDWRWMVNKRAYALPVCSKPCHNDIVRHGVSDLPNATPQQPQQGWVRFQDQMDTKLRTTAAARQYFKDKFGLDVSREGLEARMATRRSGSLVTKI